jgi:hypothetical protein
MKTHTHTYTHTSTTYTIPDLDIEVELPFTPDLIMEYKEPLVRITDDKIILGYLAHASDCANPCEDDNYMGHIYDCRRHSRTLKDYERALGLGDFDGEPRNPYAVLLDVYEHGGISYSLSGQGAQCQFDTARGGAVWVPSEELKKELDLTVADAAQVRARELAAQAAKTYTDWCNGNCYGVVVVTYDKEGTEIDHDSCWGYIGTDCAYESLQDLFPKEG